MMAATKFAPEWSFMMLHRMHLVREVIEPLERAFLYHNSTEFNLLFYQYTRYLEALYREIDSLTPDEFTQGLTLLQHTIHDLVPYIMT